MADKKLFRILIVIGIALWAIGMILNFVLATQTPGDFNFLPAIIAFFGFLIIVVTLIYSAIKFVIKRIMKSR